MVSKTSITEQVKGFDWEGVRDALAERPDLLGHRDERGRTWLHLVCAAQFKPEHDAQDGIRLVDLLLELGLGIDDGAFTEGRWKATPLWYSIGRGRHPLIARHLLERGCDPNFCLFAAVWNEDNEAIRLLVEFGAKVDDDISTDETPLLGAVGWSKWAPAQQLLDLGANPDFQGKHGRTALHLMLKKGSPVEAFEMFVAAGARGDIADDEGKTAIALLRRKRDPVWQGIADRLRSG